MKLLARSINGIGSVLLALSLGACTTLGPDFTTPEADVAETWSAAGDDRVRTDPEIYRAWWTAFDDPVLDGLIEAAYAQNLPLRIAAVRVAEARAVLGIAAGEFYPQVQQGFGSLTYNRSSERAPGAPQPGSQVDADFSFGQAEIGVGASWELDFWGRFRRGIESAEAGFFASIANYDDVLVSLTADVAVNYLLYRTSEARIAIARDNIRTQQESLDIARARFEGGATSERDVQQALSQLRGTEAAIPFLEANLERARNALAVLLGLPPREMGDILSPPGGIPLAPPEIAVGIPADLLRRRPDIRLAELQAAAQCAQIGVAKADLYPAFSLAGSFGFLASDVGAFSLDNVFDWRSRTGSIGPSFQWNILNYGRITNNVRVQDARFQETILAYQDTVLRAQQEVEDGLSDYLRGQERVVLLEKAVEASQRSSDLALIQYSEGATDYTTVLTALQALLNQQDQLVVALGNVPQAMVAVYRALGGGWEIREGEPLVPEAVAAEMENRTSWGGMLTPVSLDAPEPQRPIPTVRRPDW
jgi:NodT family efflux transporter outer membrane factor (OMF) lipoprotein